MVKVGMRIFTALLFTAFMAGLPAVAASATSSYPPGVAYVYGAANTYRTTNGVSALAFNTSLQSVAQAWAEKMAADDAGGMTTQQAFRHNPAMTLQIPSGWLGAGENIALNGGHPDPYAKLMNQWKTSPGHNANMLNPNWTDMGVGVFTDSSGVTWGVQVFAEYAVPPPVLVDYLAGIDPSSSMWAYPVTGQSGWRPRVTLGVGWDGIGTLVGIGDFDGNGQRDLIGVDANRKAWLYIGDGQLAYPLRAALAVDWTTAKFIVYGGNANGDSAPDVYTIDQGGVLWLWRGTGAGTFQAAVQVGPGYGDATLVVGPGDLNGDGCGDLLIRRDTSDLTLLAGNCTGGFAAPVVLSAGWTTIDDIYGIDFTGDGALDLLARSSSGQLILWRGNDAGGIQYVGVVDSGWSTMKSVVAAGPIILPTSTGPITPPTPDPTPTPQVATGLGDFDLDGQRDFYGITFAGEMRLYRGTGSGGVLATTPVMAANWGNTVRTFAIGDFNSDGYQDLGRTTNAGDMEVAYGGAGGTLGTPQRIITGLPAYNLILGGFDWDGDGKTDLLARDEQGLLWLYRGNGAGGWISATPEQIDSGWGSFTSVFAAGDFDGQGGVDLLARTADGTLRLYPSDGHGHFLATRIADAGWNGFTALFSPGDFDGLPGPDVLARAANGRLYLYSSDGKGGFNQQVRLVDSGWNTMWWIG